VRDRKKHLLVEWKGKRESLIQLDNGLKLLTDEEFNTRIGPFIDSLHVHIGELYQRLTIDTIDAAESTLSCMDELRDKYAVDSSLSSSVPPPTPTAPSLGTASVISIDESTSSPAPTPAPRASCLVIEHALNEGIVSSGAATIVSGRFTNELRTKVNVDVKAKLCADRDAIAYEFKLLSDLAETVCLHAYTYLLPMAGSHTPIC